MTVADRWLLPEGVEELLPAQAQQAESMRRRLLDLYRSWGYELVMPPLIEFTDSLLIGMGSDVELSCFTVTDQLSGRQMAIRPDITAQAARIDAHSIRSDEPTRLCYAGSVLHTKPKSLMASRSPIQLGAELYGEGSVAADIEVISLMLETLSSVGVEEVTLELGHVGIFRSLAADAGLSNEQENELFEVLQRKAVGEINAVIEKYIDDAELAAQMSAFTQLYGDITVLAKAEALLVNASDEVTRAIKQLREVAEQVQQRHGDLNLYFDLSELRGYHYHTGLVFGAYANGCGYAVANGGRYDDIGKVFGRARPATGFTTELKSLLNLAVSDAGSADVIFAPYCDDHSQWQQVQNLRHEKKIVICGLPKQVASSNCTHLLVGSGDEWSLQPINK